jgi:hypothetical protein
MKKSLWGLFITLLSFPLLACHVYDDIDNSGGIDLSNKIFGCDDGLDDQYRHVPLQVENLPVYIKDHLDKHFPGAEIGVAFIDAHEKDIDVYILNDGRWRELAFGNEGFERFEQEGTSVRALPQNIVDCIGQRYPGAVVQIAYLGDDDSLIVYILHNDKIIRLEFDN